MHPLVIIGASTGGTRALPEIFSRLPSLDAAYLVVQHMPKFINASFARTLARSTPGQVAIAQDGDRLAPGKLLLAPSDVHCRIVANEQVALEPGPDVNYVCPSVDVTMKSVIRPRTGVLIIGVLLTGMGKDGAEGLLHIRRLGGTTIAQDEASCAVYGMPGAAVSLDAVDRQLPPVGIAALLSRLTRGARDSRVPSLA